MPASKLVPNLKYGWTNYTAANIKTGEVSTGVPSKDVVFIVDWPIEERLFVSNDESIAFRTLAWHNDLIDHGGIGDAEDMHDIHRGIAMKLVKCPTCESPIRSRVAKPLPSPTDCRREAIGLYVCGHPEDDHRRASCRANDADTASDGLGAFVACACTGYVG